MIKLTFYNSEDTDTCYHNGYRQEFFLPDMNDPEYEVLTEGYEKEKGVFVPTRKEWHKSLRVNVLMTEPIYLALLEATMVDQVYLTDDFGQVNKVRSMQVTPSWKGYGYGMMELKFLIEEIIVIELN